MELVENTVVAGRFRLTRLLGRGGMGSVWTAQHLGLDIPCAVKFIEGDFANMTEAHQRFEREAKAAAQLRSPHVVQILDHGVCDGRPYIAMELLEGEDVGKRLQKTGKIANGELVTIITQVCRALTKAHSLGVVHRDLKPDNIFLVRDDDREIAKVLDFGIAKSNSTALDGGSNTKTGAMLGTPYYMSPEQAQGTKSVDYRSDLWSLAVIVFQCHTGRLPFESEALGDLLVKIIVHPVPVPSTVVPGVTMAFDRWFFRAASRDPAQRFQSSKEFADTLALALGVSQLSDVTDRAALQAQLAQARAAHAAGGALPPFAQTPPSAMAQSVVGDTGSLEPYQPQAGGNLSTGAPLTHTFNGQPPPQKSNTGLIVGIAFGVVLALGAAALAGITVASRKHPVAGAPGTSAVSETPPAVTPPVPPLPASAVPVASAAVAVPPEPVKSASSVVPAVPATSAKPTVHTTPPPTDPVKPPTAPASSGKKPTFNPQLGF